MVLNISAQLRKLKIRKKYSFLDFSNGMSYLTFKITVCRRGCTISFINAGFIDPILESSHKVLPKKLKIKTLQQSV